MADKIEHVQNCQHFTEAVNLLECQGSYSSLYGLAEAAHVFDISLNNPFYIQMKNSLLNCATSAIQKWYELSKLPHLAKVANDEIVFYTKVGQLHKEGKPLPKDNDSLSSFSEIAFVMPDHALLQKIYNISTNGQTRKYALMLAYSLDWQTTVYNCSENYDLDSFNILFQDLDRSSVQEIFGIGEFTLASRLLICELQCFARNIFGEEAYNVLIERLSHVLPIINSNPDLLEILALNIGSFSFPTSQTYFAILHDGVSNLLPPDLRRQIGKIGLSRLTTETDFNKSNLRQYISDFLLGAGTTLDYKFHAIIYLADALVKQGKIPLLKYTAEQVFALTQIPELKEASAKAFIKAALKDGQFDLIRSFNYSNAPNEVTETASKALRYGSLARTFRKSQTQNYYDRLISDTERDIKDLGKRLSDLYPTGEPISSRRSSKVTKLRTI